MLCRVRLNGPPPDPAFGKFYETKLEAKLVGYDALLSKTKYIAGDVSFGRGCIQLELT